MGVAATIHGMENPHTRPIHGTRWRNFRALIGTANGAITAAAQRLKKPQGQVSHFGGRNPTKVIGDQIAAEIEEAWGLPSGWLDLNHSDMASGAELGKSERQSQPVQLDPATLREAYLLAVQEAGIEGQKKYDLAHNPERTAQAYNFLAAGRTASEVAEYMAAAMRRGAQKTGGVLGKSERQTSNGAA